MSVSISTLQQRTSGGLWGSLVGDALGVPVEFMSRAEIQANPVDGMRGYGTHRQPPGTWSDDGSLILCTADSLGHHGFSTQDMGERFVKWRNEGLWTATGEVFDVGNATAAALRRIEAGTPAELAGGEDERSNGNGSLMRILPVVLRFAGEPIEGFVSLVERASAITHAHPRSKMACVLYGFVIRRLLAGDEPEVALDAARAEFIAHYEQESDYLHFGRLLRDRFVNLPEREIASTSYVLDTLHASLWCLLTTRTFAECVLKAVNLGDDSDTTGCVAGGLAGVAYGIDAIPAQWRNVLPRTAELEAVFARLLHEPG